MTVPKVTANEMGTEESFQHISVFQEINQFGPLFLQPFSLSSLEIESSCQILKHCDKRLSLVVLMKVMVWIASFRSQNFSLSFYLAISAIVIAISMITKYCKKLKYKRKIVLVTNALGSMDADDSSEIIKKIISDDMELVVMYRLQLLSAISR